MAVSGHDELVKRWLEASGINVGPLFRSVHMARAADIAIDECSIKRLVKRAALRGGIPVSVAIGLTGHSMRVGAAQDMLEAGFDSVAKMTAGGRKTQHVLLSYVENASTRTINERRWFAIAAEADKKTLFGNAPTN